MYSLLLVLLDLCRLKFTSLTMRLVTDQFPAITHTHTHTHTRTFRHTHTHISLLPTTTLPTSLHTNTYTALDILMGNMPVCYQTNNQSISRQTNNTKVTFVPELLTLSTTSSKEQVSAWNTGWMSMSHVHTVTCTVARCYYSFSPVEPWWNSFASLIDSSTTMNSERSSLRRDFSINERFISVHISMHSFLLLLLR